MKLQLLIEGLALVNLEGGNDLLSLVLIFLVATVLLAAIVSVIFYNKFMPVEIDADEEYESAMRASKKLNQEMQLSVAGIPSTVVTPNDNLDDSKFYPSIELVIEEEDSVQEEVKLSVEQEAIIEDDEIEEETIKNISVSKQVDSSDVKIVEIDPTTVILENTVESVIKQSDDDVKNKYSEIKNHIMSYDGVKDRFSAKFDTFYKGRVTLCKIAIKGNMIKLYLAINNPTELPAKYHVKDVSEMKSYAATPALLRIKSDRAVKYAKDLITMVMEDNGITQIEDYIPIDYVELYPFTEDAVIENPQVLHVVKSDIDFSQSENANANAVVPSNTHEIKELKDIDLKPIEEKKESVKKEPDVEVISGKELKEFALATSGKKRMYRVIINLDDISVIDDDSVDIDKIIDEKIVIGKSRVSLKIMSKGEIKRQVSVIADSFALEAIKMILLTGGSYVKVEIDDQEVKH